MALNIFPFVAHLGAVADAQALMDRFGDKAAPMASARADASRNHGNVAGFCHWRQIERMIMALAQPQADGTRH